MTVNTVVTLAFTLCVFTASCAESVPVYIGTYTRGKGGAKGIYRAELDVQTGKLSPPVLAAETPNPSFLEIHPNGRFLYAVGEMGNGGGVTAFAIDRDAGTLAPINSRPSGGRGPCHLNLDSGGRVVLVANYGSGSVAAIPVRPDGGLAEPSCTVRHTGSGPNPRRQKGPHAHSINPGPRDRYAYAADLGIDKVMIYRLDAAKGTLAAADPPCATLKPGAGPRHLVFEPAGRCAYVINELDCTITAFRQDPATGALKNIQTVTTLPEGFAGRNTCAEVRAHPSGRFLYGSNRGHDSIAVYRVDPGNGTLSLVEHETAGIKTPRNFTIDPTGRFCLVANQDAGSVVVFRIDAKTGALAPTGHRIAVGKPVCIRFLSK